MTGGASLLEAAAFRPCTSRLSAARSDASLRTLISLGEYAVRVNTHEAQGPLHRYLPVAERGVRKDLRLFCFLEGEERVADALDVLAGQFAVLFAEVLAERLGPL